MSTASESKLVQYLSEAYGKEKELETALTAHISMTTRKPYEKRLRQHLKETKDHARQLERRMKKIGGGGPGLVASVGGEALGRAKSLAKGPLHAVRGTGEAEKMLKNAKTEYWNEYEEIATYTAIEALAEAVNDKETAKLARDIRRDEERMAKFLAGQIPILARAVATEEVPAKERSTTSTRRRSSSSSRSRSSSAKSSSRSGSKSNSRSGSRPGSKSRARSGSKR